MHARHTRAGPAIWLAVVSVCMLLGQPSIASGQAGWTGVVADVTAYGAGAQVAFDAQGNAMAVWLVDHAVHSARYTAATGHWSAPTTVSTPMPSFSHGWLRFAMNDSGDAVAVWTVVEGGWWDYGGITNTFVARYTAATATRGPQFRVNDGREARPA